ncbi:MAG: hypothetical protein MPJ50_19655 [Pirellulales bacterium]|nr:hypothetical protein [Pirellulales bacterium]
MAREEQDREDLMQDATVFTARAEWQVSYTPEPVFVGMRSCGAASFYFGQDEVFHFNSEGQLRRGFRRGKLLKAEKTRLIELTRQRTEETVQLIRRELSRDETNLVIDAFLKQIEQFAEALENNTATLTGEILPEDESTDASMADRVHSWRVRYPRPCIAPAPHSR